jgi:hypothetical protein
MSTTLFSLWMLLIVLVLVVRSAFKLKASLDKRREEDPMYIPRYEVVRINKRLDAYCSTK